MSEEKEVTTLGRGFDLKYLDALPLSAAADRFEQMAIGIRDLANRQYTEVGMEARRYEIVLLRQRLREAVFELERSQPQAQKYEELTTRIAQVTAVAESQPASPALPNLPMPYGLQGRMMKPEEITTLLNKVRAENPVIADLNEMATLVARAAEKKVFEINFMSMPPA